MPTYADQLRKIAGYLDEDFGKNLPKAITELMALVGNLWCDFRNRGK